MEHLKSLSRDQAVRFQDEAGAGRAQKQEAQEKFYRDFVASKVTAAKRSRREGVEEGLQKGLQKGRQEGMEKGLQKGVEKGRRQVALSMLQKKLDISFISSVTGLSAEEIETLKNGS